MYSASRAHVKKVLALVMAFAMAFTMMAGAVYTDQADIVATEAVDTLAALNVMTGDPDGSFRPNDTITRAEACRMIYTIRNNGNSNADAYKGMQTTFTDVPADAWYAGYVKHCQSVGIVSGKSATSFDPNAKVTGVELALMCLRVMGYDPAKADIGGSTWSIKTIGLATEAGLLEDVEAPVEAACPRQWAAQIMFNMIDSNTVRWSNDSETYTDLDMGGNELETVGHKYMGLIDEKGIMTSVKYNENDKVYKTKVSGIDDIFDASKDYSALMGQEVKVLYKVVKSDVVLYGVYATEKNHTVTALYDDVTVTGNTAKIDGVEYDMVASIPVYAANGTEISGNDYQWEGYYEATLIDNDNDDVYECIVGVPFNVAKVDSLTAKKAYFVDALDEETTYSMDRDDLDAYEGLAEDDYVILTKDTYTVSGNWEATKAETISGKVAGTKTDGSIKVDGTWYKAAVAEADYAKAGDTLEDAVVVNGFYFTADGATGSTDKLAYVLAVDGDEADFDSDYISTKVLLSDGTVKTVKAYVKVDSKNKDIPDEKTLYTYSEKSEGMVLEAIKNGEDIGLKATEVDVEGGYNSKTNKIDGLRLAADAKVFVCYEGTKGKLVTGAAADKWADGTYAATAAYMDGTVKVLAVNLNAEPDVSDDSVYGVVLTAPYKDQNDDGDDFWVIDELWTESGLVEDVRIDVDEVDCDDLVKNMLISYTMNGEDYVNVDVAPANATAVVGAVTEVDGDYIDVKTADGELKLKLDDDDSTVLYFDSDNATGNTNGSIKKAGKKDADSYYANVLVVYKTAANDDETNTIWAIAADLGNMLLDDADEEVLVSLGAE